MSYRARTSPCVTLGICDDFGTSRALVVRLRFASIGRHRHRFLSCDWLRRESSEETDWVGTRWETFKCGESVRALRASGHRIIPYSMQFFRGRFFEVATGLEWAMRPAQTCDFYTLFCWGFLPDLLLEGGVLLDCTPLGLRPQKSSTEPDYIMRRMHTERKFSSQMKHGCPASIH